MMGENRAGSGSLWNKDLIVIYGVIFLAYANISVFFQFFNYLKTLGLDESGSGFLIGVFSIASLLVRPIISPLIHRGNVRFYLALGTLLAVSSLASYTPVTGFWSMCLARIFHGVAFTILGAALMTLLVDYIPPDRSAQAFGLLGIIVVLPNTVVPPLVPFLMARLGGFTQVLLLFAGITLLILPLVLTAGRKSRNRGGSLPDQRLTWPEIIANLKEPRILLLLIAMLLLYSSHALVFFFLAGYAKSIALAGAGFFFTLTSVGEIGVRLAAGSFFDRENKTRVTSLTLLGLAAAYALLGHASEKWLFFPLGMVLGVGWGVAMPVLNGLMFDISKPETRAFNTNLGLQTFQAGFFLGPFVGGFVVEHGGFSVLFYLCSALSIAGALFLSIIGRLMGTGDTRQNHS